MPTTNPARTENCAPVFLVGTGRCGTSMLRRILRAHPNLVIPNETHWIPLLNDRFGFEPVPLSDIESVVRSLRTGRGKSILDRICQEESLNSASFFEQIGQPNELLSWPEFHRRFGTLLARNSDASTWGDKTPDYGLCIDLIAQAWPDARFIHLVRDGRDVALSMRKVPSFQQLAERNLVEWKYLAQQEAHKYTGNETLPVDRYFKLWLDRIRTTGLLISNIPGHRVFEVRYEDLTAVPADTLEQLADFIRTVPDSGWIAHAVMEIRPGNALANLTDPGYLQLTAQYEEVLRWFDSRYPRAARQAEP